MQDETAGGRAALPKLPLRNVIKLSYATYFENFPDVLRIVWVWLLILVPVSGMANWLQASWMSEILARAHAQPGTLPPFPSHPILSIAAGYAAGLILLTGGVGIAVAWHRRLILDEPPSFSGSNIVTSNFWRYILTGLSIGLITVLPAFAVGFVTVLFIAPYTGGEGRNILMVAVLFVLYAAVFGAFLRLNLLLPANAVGNFDLEFEDSWHATRGNTWRLFWGMLACCVPSLLVVQIMVWLVIGHPSPERFATPGFAMKFATLNTLMNAGYLFLLPIAIGFLSHAYRYFFERARIA